LIITLAAFAGKAIVIVRRPSIRLSRQHTYRDSRGGSWHTFWPNKKKDRQTTAISDISWMTMGKLITLLICQTTRIVFNIVRDVTFQVKIEGRMASVKHFITR